MTVAKVDRKVRALVDMIERGELRLPEMQRQYVWTATRVRDLLDSLYRGYPSGVILAWESDETIATRDFAVDTAATAAVRPLLLLDGQQRLTSLSAVLRGEPVKVRNRKRSVDILFNLEHPDALTFVTEVNENSTDDLVGEEDTDDSTLSVQDRLRQLTFVVGNRALESLPNWVRVSDVFTKTDSELLRASGVTGFEDPNFERYTARLKAVRAIADYEYRMDILERSKSYEEVTEIFVRVNSLGAKLRSSDLALAQITAKWRGSLDVFRSYQDELERRGFDLEIGTILRVLIALVTGQSKFQSVNAIPLPTLQAGWDRAKKALDFALNFAKSNLGVDSPSLLSSPFLFITLAYWADNLDYRIEPQGADDFRRWFLVSNAKGRYSRGSSETILSEDLALLRDGGTPEDLIQRLTQQVGRLDFSVDELVGRTARSGAFKTMFLAFRQDRARDWETQLEISPKHEGSSDVIEYHHIFPKAFLKRERPGLKDALVNDIANLAFIGASTNRRIRDSAPAKYRSLFKETDLVAQQIRFEGGTDLPENFESFLERRRIAIAKRLNAFLGVDPEGRN